MNVTVMGKLTHMSDVHDQLLIRYYEYTAMLERANVHVYS